MKMHNQFGFKKYFCIAGLLMMILSGCDKNLTSSYLMQHPLILKKELIQCQTDDSEFSMEAKCQLVVSTAHDLMQLIEEQQADPEKFGQKIMHVQSDVIASTKLLDQQQKIVNDLKNKDASSSELQIAEGKLKQIQEEVNQKQYELNVLMGVIGLNSPE